MIETFFYKSVVGGGDVDDSVRYLLVGWVQIWGRSLREEVFL